MKSKVLLSAILLSASTANAEKGHQFFVNATTFQANNAVSLDQLDKTLDGFSTDQSRLYAVGENQIEIGIKKNDFEFSVYKRSEIFVSADRETGQLISDTNNDALFVTSELYPVDLHGYGIEQTGVAISRHANINLGQEIKPMAFSASGRIYKVDRYREVQIEGAIANERGNVYEATVDAIERNSRAEDPTAPDSSASGGIGFAADFSVAWPISNKVLLTASIRDAFNSNLIHDLPTETRQVEGSFNPFSILRPVPRMISATQREDYQFKLPKKYSLAARIALEKRFLDTVKLGLMHSEGLTQSRVGLEWKKPLKHIESVEIGYETYFKPFDITIDFKYGGFKFGLDSFNKDKRRVEYLQTYVNIQFDG